MNSIGLAGLFQKRNKLSNIHNYAFTFLWQVQWDFEVVKGQLSNQGMLGLVNFGVRSFSKKKRGDNCLKECIFGS